ncbi:hypothetical protein BDV96DRAFT_592868 [Lophiotrema nucula]|uniref:Uncharacterized protein n=1 Tax=Lophiotrema nucula TaxID=690887 RepID=A0A6A5YGF3_9PLEO|nr:hypothetical protein BDV96DRAFT_592868 [Lophiotrema nucula]
MSSASGPHRVQQPLSIDMIIAKMQTAAETINLRGGVKPHERKRVKEAFALLTQLSQLPNVKTSERRERYQYFLRQVNEGCGSQPVVVCAAGVGGSAIAAMREHDRLRLPLETKRQEASFKSLILYKLAEECYSKGGNSILPIRCII